MPNPVTLAHVVEVVVETIHLTSEHRDGKGGRPPLHACPSDPCYTWRRFLAESGWQG